MKDKEKQIDNSWRAKMVEKGLYKDSETTSKEKQIEEMAKVLCEYCHDICEEKECPYSEHEESMRLCYNSQLEIAIKLHNAGYRKLPKDSVVLTREEYEKLTAPRVFVSKKQLSEKELAEKLKNFNYGIIGVDESSIEIIPTRAEIEKETAEKIIDLIKTFCPDKKFIEIITHIIRDRCGVEIKE